MSSFGLVAGIIAGFFLAGIAVGIVAVIAVSAVRPRQDRVRSRYDLSLDPDNPKDAEKIVERWLASRDSASDGDS